MLLLQPIITLCNVLLRVRSPEICVTLPADDKLYDYYRRFRFKELTVNVASLLRDEAETLAKPYDEQELVVGGYCGIRNRVLKDNFLFWNNNHIEYAFDYYALYGAIIIKNNFGYAIALEENDVCEVIEFICADANAPYMLFDLLNRTACQSFRFRLSPNCKFFKSEPEKFAMAGYATRYEPDHIYSGLTLD